MLRGALGCHRVLSGATGCSRVLWEFCGWRFVGEEVVAQALRRDARSDCQTPQFVALVIRDESAGHGAFEMVLRLA